MLIQPVSNLRVYFQSEVNAAGRRLGQPLGFGSLDYLARLLVDMGTGEARDALHRSVVLSLDAALALGRGRQIVELQSVGDGALCTIALFPTLIENAGIEPSLYAHVGRFAYRRAADLVAAPENETIVLRDLDEHFSQYADVLAEVAQSSALGTVTRDLVRSFDRWKNLDSRAAFLQLAREGVFPAPGDDEPC